MENDQRNLYLISLLSFATILIEVAGVQNPVLRLLVACPLVFLLPGYVLMDLIFPGYQLENLERWLLNMGISLVMTILVGFALNLTPWGLEPATWAISLGGITIVLCAIAIARRRILPSIKLTREIGSIGLRPSILLFVAFLVTVLAVAFARYSTSNLSRTFTILWMVPDDKSSTDVFDIGITNWESKTVSYRLIVQANGQVVQEWPVFSIQPGNTWENVVTIPEGSSRIRPVKAFLYRLDDPVEVYRTTTWWSP